MSRCTLESVLVCPCIEVLPLSESDCAMLGLVFVADCYYNIQSVGSACLSSSCCRLFHSHIMCILLCQLYMSGTIELYCFDTSMYSCFLPVLVAISLLPRLPCR